MKSLSTINRKILALALPAIASNITVPLLGLCDTAVTGHLGSEAYIAAIAAGGMMLNVVFWVFGFLRMGTTGLTAEAHGAADPKRISCVFSRAVILALVAGLLIVAVRQPMSRLLLGVIGADADVTPLAARYFAICIWGAPALLVTLTINGWFIGMQNTVWPMAVSIAVNVVNVACSLTAVYALGMGFEGVAYGTLTANWTGLCLAVVAVVRYSRGMRLWSGWRMLWRGDELRKFFGVSEVRNVEMKEVVMEDVRPALAVERLERLRAEVAAFLAANPASQSYAAYWLNGYDRPALHALRDDMEQLIDRLSNSRDKMVINTLMDIPVIRSLWFISPVHAPWLSWTMMILFPVGVPVWLYGRYTQRRLRSELETVSTVAARLITLINPQR